GERAGSLVEDLRSDAGRAEVRAAAGIRLAHELRIVVLALVEIELEVRVAGFLALHLALAVALVADRERAVVDRGLEVVAADAVDLERHVVGLRLRVRSAVVLRRCAERVAADLLEQAARGRRADVRDLHVDRDRARLIGRGRGRAGDAAGLGETALR